MKIKRFLAAFLACVMIFTCLPVTAMVTAADGFDWVSADQLTGYADSTCLGLSPANFVDGSEDTQWHTNYAGEDSDSGDPFVEGSGGNLTANNNLYVVMDQPMNVEKLQLYTNENPNAQILAVNVYVSSEEYTKGAELQWGEVVGSASWDLISGPGSRELVLDEVQTNVKSIRIEVTKVNGNTNIRCSEVKVYAEAYEVEYEFADVDSSKLTAYADSAISDCPAANAVDGSTDTQWHTNYDANESDPFVEGSGGNLTANNNLYVVIDEAMPVDKLTLWTNSNPNAQILAVNVYVSSEEYTKGAELDWGEVVGSADWALISGPGSRELVLDEVQFGVKSIRIEVTKVNGDNNIRCSEVIVSGGTAVEAPEEPVVPEVEYEFAYIDSAKLTAYADSAISDCPASNAVDGDTGTQWHTNYDANESDPFVEGSGGDLTGNNNLYVVIDETMPVDKLTLWTNDNPNAQILAVNVYVSSEEYTKGADLDWGEVVGSANWDLISGPGSRELTLDEIQSGVKSIRIEVTKVNGDNNIRCSEVIVSGGTAVEAPEEPEVPEVEYEFDFIDSSRLTAYADSSCLGYSPENMVDDDMETQWHTNYEGDKQSSDPLVEGSGGSLTANNNFYVVLDESMPVDKLALYTNYNPNAQILCANVYVSSEEYTDDAELAWGEAVGNCSWSLASGPIGREIVLDEIQYNVKSIRVEVTKVNGDNNIRCSEVMVSVGTPKEIVYEYEYLTPDQMTGYADSSYSDTPASNAVDGDIGTQWHTNYQDANMSDDPLVEGTGGSLTGNNNYYIVLSEPMPVDKLSFYTDTRNANIRSLNIYVSSEEYTKGADLEWGEVVGSASGWELEEGQTREVTLDEIQFGVKSIRIEVTEVNGNTNIRGIEFGVSAGKVVEEEPDVPEEPDEPVVPGEKPMFTMAVLADIHVDSGIERYDNPIRSSVTATVNAWAEEEDIDLIAFPGDNVSSHLGSYWGANGTQKKQTFDNVKAAFMDAVYTATDSGRAVFVGGNHDYRVGMLDFNSADYTAEMESTMGELIPATSVEDVSANAFFQTEFPAGTAEGVENVLAYHYNVDGLDFIMLNPPYQMDENVYYYDMDALEWVSNKMADIGSDQTVFIVGHYPLQDGKDGAPDTDAETHRVLKEEILCNYPKAIYVYGHYHTQILYEDTYERLNTYMADGTLCTDRDTVTDGFITVFGGSMAYYGDAVTPSGGLGAATPNVVQALLIYVYEDRIVFQMKNYGTEDFGLHELEPYVVYRDVAAEDDISGLKEALKEALKAAEDAKAVAEEAQAAAEAASAKAEAAKLVAEEAAKANAENTEAAAKAKQAAETAQAEAEAAEAAAKAAQTAAETAANAAETANAKAAKEALKAAEEAAKAASSAEAAAGSAQTAAEAQAAAQAAQAKAEEAQAAAEAAQAKAEAAQAAAEAAEAEAAKDKAAAEAARKAAEDAETAAKAAVKEAEAAQAAAEAAKTAADASNKDAAAEAVKAAEAAADAAEAAGLVAQYAASAAEAQAKAQEAQAKAEAAQAVAEEAQKRAEQAAEEARIAAELESAKQQALMEIMIFNLGQGTDELREDQKAAYKTAITDATAAVIAAGDAAEVEAALETMEKTVDEIFALRCAAEEFADVELDAWYHDAVDFVLNEGMMSGNGDGTFAPETALSRAMLVQILYNIEGKPEVQTDKSFSDVSEADWYYNAVMWAAENGIVLGNDDGTYAPDDSVTREQMVTILYRYAGSPEVEGAEITFADADAIDEWAEAAVAWAVAGGVVKGKGENTFDPDGNSTRAETAQVMLNYFGK